MVDLPWSIVEDAADFDASRWVVPRRLSLPLGVVEHPEKGGYDTPSWFPRRISRYREWLRTKHPNITLRVQATSKPPHDKINTLVQVRSVEYFKQPPETPYLSPKPDTELPPMPETLCITTSHYTSTTTRPNPMLTILTQADKYLSTRAYPCKRVTGENVTESFDAATGILISEGRMRLILYGRPLKTVKIKANGWKVVSF